MKAHLALVLGFLIFPSAPISTAQSDSSGNVIARHVTKVRFTFRNDSNVDIALRCGDQVIALKSKESLMVTLPEGVDVTAEHGFGTTSEGATLIRVTKILAGTTVTLR